MGKKSIGVKGRKVAVSLGGDNPFFEWVLHVSISDDEFSPGSFESISHVAKASQSVYVGQSSPKLF